eukprot:Lithocolla_globosa_v1_NODE_424_length_4101_cov_9.723431.p1 type:complete len:997 gc:universal NODE_424_length_4101_cov_9.723431:1097-4087(+)
MSMKIDNKTVSQLDVAFTFDTTGSMGSWIMATKKEIKKMVKELEKQASSTQFGLVPYKDYCDKEVTKVYPFSSDLSEIQKAVDSMQASGGGDEPEAVALALDKTLNELKWRTEAVKVAVVIADAPPHGLSCAKSHSDSLPKGEPDGKDPIACGHAMRRQGISLFVVGCGLRCSQCIDFYSGMADLTGGIYMEMKDASQLLATIVSGVRQELELSNLKQRILQLRDDQLSLRPMSNLVDIANDIAQHLQMEGVTVHHVKAMETKDSENRGFLLLSSNLQEWRQEMEFAQSNSNLSNRANVAPPPVDLKAGKDNLIQPRHVMRVLLRDRKSNSIQSQDLDPNSARLPVGNQVQLYRFLRLGFNEQAGKTESENKQEFMELVKNMLSQENEQQQQQEEEEESRKNDVLEIVTRVATSPAPPKPTPALLTLALCIRYGNNKVKARVTQALLQIARTPTHLFEYIECVESLDEKTTGWGRAQRRAVKQWYLSKSGQGLATSTTKFWNRKGWTHADVVRLAHPKVIFPTKIMEDGQDKGNKKQDDEEEYDMLLDINPPGSNSSSSSSSSSFSSKDPFKNAEELSLVLEYIATRVRPAAKSLKEKDQKNTSSMEGIEGENEERQNPTKKRKRQTLDELLPIEEVLEMVKEAEKQDKMEQEEEKEEVEEKKRFRKNKSVAHFLAAVEVSRQKNPSPMAMMFLIRKFGLVREHVPTSLLNDAGVWKALIHNMPPMALLRNLNKITALNILQETKEMDRVLEILTDCDKLVNQRINPLDILVALDNYSQGKGEKGSLEWEPNVQLVKALENCFHNLIKHLVKQRKPSSLRICLGIDLRASMLAKIGSCTARKAAAATALVWKSLQPGWKICVFGFDGCLPLEITVDTTLTQLLNQMEKLTPGPADPASLLADAADRKEKYDGFVAFTAMGVYQGDEPLSDQLSLYRQMSGVTEACLLSVTMAPSRFSIVDQDDAGLVDLVFSSSLLDDVITEMEWATVWKLPSIGI